VLIVDDDLDHAESIADVLSVRGYDVEVAGSGEEAVARFRDDADFDVVLMDVKLPGMNGVEAFFEFKKIRPPVRVMMMTGYSVEQLVAQAVDNGALGVLHKPFAVTDLLATLDRVKPRSLVVVADDDPDFVTSIEPVLAASGYAVEVASTGAEALEMMAGREADCLILDMRLPVMSGVEVYSRLQEKGCAVPTILVTGYAGAEEAENVERLRPQAHGLLYKPFDPGALLEAVGAAARLRR